MLARHASPGKPLFVAGSSGVESALTAHWAANGQLGASTSADRLFAAPVSQIIAICGSCSPVTAGQIKHAIDHGFVEVPLEPEEEKVVERVLAALGENKSVVIHTGMIEAKMLSTSIGQALASLLRRVLTAHRIPRLLIAGGDTSSQIARGLGIQSLEMIAPLTRGSPLCRVTAPGSPIDGLEMTFKGGQIGPVDFFSRVLHGHADG